MQVMSSQDSQETIVYRMDEDEEDPAPPSPPAPTTQPPQRWRRRRRKRGAKGTPPPEMHRQKRMDPALHHLQGLQERDKS